jgi:UDP-N-acetylmuramoyl-tripeptide--D-alanyl-D-alanine ligase
MLELGKESGEMHRGVGRYAAEKGVELVLTAGTYGRDTAAGAGEAGVCFESRDALISALPRLIAEGDCLLVKASKGSHFELVSAALRKLAEQHAGAECAGERGKL